MSIFSASIVVTPPGIQAGSPVSGSDLPNANDPSLGYLPDDNNSFETGIVIDQLANLIEMSFDGTPFPAVSFKEVGSQDLAVHKYPNLDSARIENTGRNPMIWTVRAVFTNNIYPSVNESWIAGTLYPGTFEAVRTSLEDTTTPIKILMHPNDGPVNVVVQTWTWDYIGTGPRDGVFMDIVFMETLAENQITTDISPSNPSAQLSNTAASLDDLIGNDVYPIQPPGMSLNGFFSNIANTIQNAIAIPTSIVASLAQPIFIVNVSFNQTVSAQQFYQGSTTQYVSNNNNGSLLSSVNTGAPVPNYSYQALQNVYNAAFSLNVSQNNSANQFIYSTLGFLNNLIIYYTSVNSVQTAQIKLNLYLMIQQLQQIQQNLFKNSSQYAVQQYTTQGPTTIIQLSNILNNSVDQLLSLNPGINKTLLIPASIAVNYFQG